MEVTEIKTWIIFYLLSFVVLLWALFLTTQGIMLGIGLTMVIVVVGINFSVMYGEIQRLGKKRDMMKALTVSPDLLSKKK